MGKGQRSLYSLREHPEAGRRAYWLLRDYPRLKRELDAIDGYGSGRSEPSGGRRNSSSVETAVMRRSRISDEVGAVEKALKAIPEEYKDGVLSSIIDRKPYPDMAALNTWKKYRQMLIYKVAQYAGYLYE